jgi:hypothetical protein
MPTHHLHGVIAVARGVHLVAALAEEQEVRLEELDLVVDPEDSFLGGRHCSKLR